MKKSILLLILSVCMVIFSDAQDVPAGMKYQAVARTTSGEVLPNRSITLRIELKNDPAKGSVVYYSEEHSVTTNQFGLFDLVVGMGKTNKGLFATIPWSTEDIWMGVSLKDKDAIFSAVTETRLLAVPYAFHALTASTIVNKPGNETANAQTPGVPANVWSLQGNSNSNPATDKLGTTDYKDLVMVTNNIERFRITAAGDISINNSLKVGVNVEVGNDLIVKKNVFLNTVSGVTVNNGAFTVANTSPTSLTGILTVNKATTILDSLSVIRNTEYFAAYINNTNDGPGDGLQIKLGKTHPRWTGSSYANVANPMTGQLDNQMNQIRNWIYGNQSFDWSQLIGMIPNQAVVGSMCNITNYITQNINNALNLPLKIGPYSTPTWSSGDLFHWGGYYLGLPSPAPNVDIGGFTVPGVNIPSLPVIPQVTVMPAIPQIGCGSLPSISFPNFVFNNVNNTLSKENEFISFVDKDDRKLGAIRAQSIQNFSYDYFDGQKMLEIAGELIGIDLADDFVSLVAGISQMAVDYNKIGVEYSSGNGDYAEWLERKDAKEDISFGDIVGVKGGKISKDITGAEQIMAVSKNPIVLGNMPEASKTNSGNNIAFMGQIPVKIIGAVQSGDYIIAKSDIPGYGVAVHPKDMKLEDFKLAVGRSWDSNPKEGPKMVNTVVGVHNHDFLNIIASLQKKSENTEDRLKIIEGLLNVNTGTNKAAEEKTKKAFK